MPAQRQKPSAPRKKAQPAQNSYGARINQLFQDAIRDLEALKEPPRRKPAQSRRGA